MLRAIFSLIYKEKETEQNEDVYKGRYKVLTISKMTCMYDYYSIIVREAMMR